MPFMQGQVYACTDPTCGCEIAVTRSAQRSEGTHTHRCCCGREMTLKR